jgi:uncharacterized membrane protein YqiK
MSDALDANPRAVIGGNLPPLAELLPVETAEIEKKAGDLIGGVERAKVTDQESAGRATLLAGMIKSHLATIDDARASRKRPYLEAGRAVDAHFNGIAARLAIFDPEKKVIGGPLFTVLGMVDKFRRDEEAKAEAERRRLEEAARVEREKAAAAERARREAEEREAAAAREAAERVRRAEEEARRAGDREAAAKAAQARAEQAKAEAEASERRLAADIEARRAAVASAELDRQAAAVTAKAIDSGLGVKASGRKVWKVEIYDLTAAIRHARKVDEATVRAAVQQIFDRQVKAGVRTLPGARVIEDSTTIIKSVV